ncbi:MAG: MFS transporter, partial [Sporomusaceae bacterium]|nr:MFS transporter [Sporomusaceae bacterium]
MIKKQTSVPQQLWTKDFFLICLSNLFIFTSFYCLLPTLPLLITDVLAGDTSGVGYIFGIFALAAVF